MNKNKIIIDNKEYYQEEIFLENKNISNIEVNGQVKINLLNCKLETKIIINDYSKCLINYFNLIDELNSDINIIIKDTSSLTINHSFITNKLYNFNLVSNFLAKESSININLHGINNKGTTNIKIDGIIAHNKNDNNLLENVRLININDGKGKVLPNMLISTSKVIANHNVTISDVNSDELLYLMSKGLSKEESIKLICNGHLVSIINDDKLKIQIKELISGR